jgi:hypothetical protein
MWRSLLRQWSGCMSRYCPAASRDGRCLTASCQGQQRASSSGSSSSRSSSKSSRRSSQSTTMYACWQTSWQNGCQPSSARVCVCGWNQGLSAMQCSMFAPSISLLCATTCVPAGLAPCWTQTARSVCVCCMLCTSPLTAPATPLHSKSCANLQIHPSLTQQDTGK